MDPHHQKLLADHLAACRFLPGHYHKKFAHGLQDPPYTARQLWYLCFLVRRYRKQIQIPDVINLANRYLMEHKSIPEKIKPPKKEKPGKKTDSSQQTELF